MEAVFEYKIDHDLKINYDIISGEVNLDKIINHEKKRICSNEFNENYNSLVDIRGAIFVDFMYDIQKFCGFLNDFTKEINMKRKCAIVTSTPMEVVNSVMFASGLKNMGTNLQFESFSTLKAAIKWLSE